MDESGSGWLVSKHKVIRDATGRLSCQLVKNRVPVEKLTFQQPHLISVIVPPAFQHDATEKPPRHRAAGRRDDGIGRSPIHGQLVLI
jgi:hypothetical protein